MNVRSVSGFGPVVRDVAASRAFRADTLGLAFEGEVGDCRYTEALDGVKHLGLWPLSEAAQACSGRPQWPEDIPVPSHTRPGTTTDGQGVEVQGTEVQGAEGGTGWCQHSMPVMPRSSTSGPRCAPSFRTTPFEASFSG